MAKSFHQLAARTQEARVREALASGEKPEAGAITIYLGLPESEVEAVAEVLARLNGEKPVAKKPVTEANGFDPTAKATIAKVVKLKTSGKTIKQIAEAFGLPAEQHSWGKVSKVWRSEADRLGLDRPRRNGSSPGAAETQTS
jgi:hypothetical protein